MPVVQKFKGFGQSSVELAQEMAQLKNTQGVTDAFFVADVGQVDQLVDRWCEVLPRVRPYYSVQCNADEVLLSTLAKHPSIGFHCTTRQNTAQILNVVHTPNRVFYSNPCWTRGSLTNASSNGITFLGFDSLMDIRRIYEQAPQANLMLNICMAPNEEDPSSTFGCCPADSPDLLRAAFDLGLTVVGIGFNVGHGKNTSRMFERSIEAASQLFKIGKEIGHDMRVLNIGGGFESDYYRFEAIACHINNALDEFFSEHSELEVMATPGRFFAASVFSLVTNIIDKDEVDASHISNDDFDSGKQAYIYKTNEGYYGPFGCKNRSASPSCGPLFKSPGITGDIFCTSFMGPTGDEYDHTLFTCRLSQLSVGDWLLWSNMGAYSLGNNASLDSELCQELPIYYVKSDDYWFNDADSGIDNSAGNSDTESVVSDDDDLSDRVWASWMADFAGRERAANSFSF